MMSFFNTYIQEVQNPFLSYSGDLMSLPLTQACPFQRATNDRLLTPKFKKGLAFLTL